MSRPAQFSVVIPAHNEASVIDRCLNAFLPDLAEGEAEVVVVSNGSTDDTVERARRHGVRVIDLAESSKVAALNAGDEAVSAFPRVYLDADIVLDAATLRALVQTLHVEHPAVAAPRVRFVTQGRPLSVRSFYRAYEQTPYIRQGLIGLGVYGMNAAARARFDRFPDVVGDDLFVQRLLPENQRLTSPGEFDVQVPRDLRSLIKVRRRTAAGNRQFLEQAAQLDAQQSTAGANGTGIGLDQADTSSGTARALADIARSGPQGAFDAFVYTGVTAAGRLRSQRQQSTWWRDDSTREAASGPGAEAPEVAYLVSMYPKVSHAFIEREIQNLRALGWNVETYSVNQAPPQELVSDLMRSEAARTTALLSGPKPRLALGAATIAARHPGAAATALRAAVEAGRGRPRGTVYQLFYLAEAMLLHDAMRRRPARHLHVHFANNGADIARLATRFANAIDGAPNDARAWTWSIAMHGPTEFAAPGDYDLSGKFADADLVAAITGFCAGEVSSLLAGQGDTPVAVVPMSVDVEHFSPAPSSERESGPLRVLYVGRLVPEKRPGDLIDALARAQRAGVECELTVIGAGPLADDLAAQVATFGASGVRFLGAVGQPELPAWYHWADVLVLPSEAEGLPVVLMEAMASGTAVITTRIAGIPELVEHGRSGYLLEPGDVSGIADALAELAHEPQRLQRLGREARDAVVARHESTVTGKILDEELRAVSRV